MLFSRRRTRTRISHRQYSKPWWSRHAEARCFDPASEGSWASDGIEGRAQTREQDWDGRMSYMQQQVQQMRARDLIWERRVNCLCHLIRGSWTVVRRPAWRNVCGQTNIYDLTWLHFMHVSIDHLHIESSRIRFSFPIVRPTPGLLRLSLLVTRWRLLV